MPENTNNIASKNGIIAGAVIAGVALAITVSVTMTKAAEEAAELARLTEIAEIRAILDNPNIYDNIYIENINMSNISADSAKNMLIEKMSKPSITFTYNSQEFVLTPEDMGLTYGIAEAVDEAINLGRDGNDEMRLQTLANFETDIINIEVAINYDMDIIKSKIDEIAKSIYVAPIEPTIAKNGSKFSMSGGSNGISMDIEKAFNDLMLVIEEPTASIIEISTNVITPTTTEESVAKMGDILGTFTTNFSGGTSVSNTNRNTNMRIAANNINATVIPVGGVFSTNKEFGPTTKENGFQLGASYLNGEIVQSYGGGVCQVSSTLYMAVLHSELQIVERQNHSMPVGYIGYGYDATLAGDYIDLKFKNNTNAPIYVESYLSSNNQVVCTIYGYDERSASRSIKFENTLSSSSASGFTYKVYKLVYDNNNFVEKIHINNSYYKSTGGGTATTSAVGVNTIAEVPTEATTQVITEVTTQATTSATTEAPITETTIEVSTYHAPETEDITEVIPESTTETITQAYTEATTEVTTEVTTQATETTTIQVEVPTETTTQEPTTAEASITIQETEIVTEEDESLI